MAGGRNRNNANGDAAVTIPEVATTTEVKEKPTMNIEKVKRIPPVIPSTVAQRYFLVGFSMSWTQDGEFRRIDDVVRIAGMPGYPNLNELRKQIPRIFEVEGQENVSVYNVVPMELSKEDFEQFTE